MPEHKRQRMTKGGGPKVEPGNVGTTGRRVVVDSATREQVVEMLAFYSKEHKRLTNKVKRFGAKDDKSAISYMIARDRVAGEVSRWLDKYVAWGLGDTEADFDEEPQPVSLEELSRLRKVRLNQVAGGSGKVD